MSGRQVPAEVGLAAEREDKSFSITAPPMQLPKGGGAILGIGEKFAPNLVTGTGSMSVPIATSSGRSGFGPQLSLSYDSGPGNGPFGFGGSLSLPSITRKTDKGLPQYFDADDSDFFTLYGFDADVRIAYPLDASHIFTWLICETRDDKGNAVLPLQDARRAGHRSR